MMIDPQEETFTARILTYRLHRNLKILRDNELLLDFTINVEGQKFKTHKVLLAASSDYFNKLFTHQEDHKDSVTLKDISITAITAVLDFFYTGQIALTIYNVQEILLAASILQTPELIDICAGYIKIRVDISNCLGVYNVAQRCNLERLKISTLEYCLDKFEFIVDELEFQQIDESCLLDIISHNQLNIDSEEKVFKAIIKWISHDVERISKFDDLITAVRFPLIDARVLVDISNNELVKKSIKCNELIDEAKNFLLLKEYHDQKFDGPRYQHRYCLRRQQRIYAVGGWTNEFKPIASVEKYDPYRDEWTEVNPMSKPRCGVGAAFLDDSLYAIGGHDGQNYLKCCERFDVTTGIWHQDVPELESTRTSVGVVALNGYIYAIGGQIGSNSSSIVERYNPKDNVWEQCKSMHEKRFGAGVTVLNGLIYVMGGADTKVLNSVEYFDPAKDEWNYLAPMTTSRKHLGCTNLNGKIYAVGGRGEASELETAECYDPESDFWDPITDMSVARSGIGLVALDDLLYAIGGHNGDKRLSLVESYDTISKVWTLRKPMIHDRLGGGLAVHSKMNNRI